VLEENQSINQISDLILSDQDFEQPVRVYPDEFKTLEIKNHM
jgi:hypothetical protein